MKTRIFCIVLCCFPWAMGAQSTNSLLRKADKLLGQGLLQDAAPLYEKAGRMKGNHSEALYRAGECYYRLREYEKAAACYAGVKNLYKRETLAGLRYGRAVKQSGRCAEAVYILRDFAKQFNGAHKAQVLTVVQNEIKGCEIALDPGPHGFATDPMLEVQLLPETVNSPENEFGPIPFTDQLLYFSVNKAEKIQFMRAIRENKAWQQASLADGLPASLQEKFGNGAFSPDGKRFYFTQCRETGFSYRRSSGGGSFCAIYMLQRVANNWSEPVALPEYINLPKANNTHPFIAHQDGKEWLYFTSDREGGFGGLDIYRCSRNLGQETSPFSLPQNLGNMINSAGDEVTPFYDTFNNTLWFSSNGQVTLGGLDIFKSVREEGQWLPLENAGTPLNSVADDLFFIKKKSGKGGFWVSNRVFGTQKQQTNNQDIFEFYYKDR